MSADKRISGPAEYAAGWDKIDSILEPLDRDGIPYVIVIGIPGTDETRMVSSHILSQKDVDHVKHVIDTHFTKFPPKGDADV